MKKVILTVVLLGLCACASVSKNISNKHPGEYGLNEELEGSLYSIKCKGNGYADDTYVEDKCKEYMSEFAYENGYNFFSVLNQNGDVDSIGISNTYSNASAHGFGNSVYGYGNSNTYFNNIKKYSKSYLFVLISELNKNKWNNYYRVSDYYNKD